LLVRRRGCVIRITAEIADAGIRAEQINGPGAAFRFRHQFLDVRFVADIADNCQPADDFATASAPAALRSATMIA
jgi:hypothetical protein